MVKSLIWRLLGLVLLLLLAIAWVLLDPRPALAQEKALNCTNAQLQNRDFSEAESGGFRFRCH